MLKSYIKMAWRNMRKNPVVSAINLSGLAIGITCCLLITVYILNELSYDRYNKNADNTYRVERTFNNPGNKGVSLELGAVAPPIGPLMKHDFKEIGAMTSLVAAGNMTLQYKDNIFTERYPFFADDQLFNVFDVKLIKGNYKDALTEPNSIVLTEKVARKYFGDEDPINKVLRVDQQFSAKVTGIFKELPNNSHWHPEVLISFATLRDSAVYGEESLRTNWGNNMFYTYFVLPPNYRPENLEVQLPAFLNRHVPGADNKASEWTSLSLRKVTDIHLHSHKDSEIEENGDIKRVYIFGLIGLFILIIACINYMNLSTARSALRAKEIGIRKVSGALRKELITQFLTESILICAMATVASFIISAMIMPWLNGIAERHFLFADLLRPVILIPAILLPFFIGAVAGSYPAVFLSSFKPVKVLKGLFKAGSQSVSMRKALVVVQFSVSIVLIISTVIVYQQLRYIQNKSLGFNKDQLLVLNNSQGLNESFVAFRQELLANGQVKDVARSSRIPSGRLLDAMGSEISVGNGLAPTKADIKYVDADEGFIPTYRVNLLAGRNFQKPDGTDTSSFIINESAVRALGLTSIESALGKPFKYGNRLGQIVGVIQDFNFESLHQRILPIILRNARKRNDYNRISIKVSGNPKNAISHIESTWKKYLPEVPFEYGFLDQRFSELYKAEQQQQLLFMSFSLIAIFIACLGLFGLSAFTISQRIKEIGVRKVLGASVVSIVALVSKDFLLLVGVSALIAFPITWLAMDNWLNDFAYRTQISWWVFIMVAAVALLIAFITISFQAVKAALTNPTSSLRSE